MDPGVHPWLDPASATNSSRPSQQTCRLQTSASPSRASMRCSLVRRFIPGGARGRLTVKPAEELLALSAHSRPHHQQAQSVVMRSPRAPHEGRPHGPHVASDNRVDPSPRSASPPPRALAPGSPGRSRSSNSDEERKHACPECGKAFNRPSSLAIHVNTHTGAKRACARLSRPVSSLTSYRQPSSARSQDAAGGST